MPWHSDDLNALLKKNDAYALFRHPIGDNLEPVWPEKWPTERLEQRRREIGSLSFSRGYRLVCAADDDVPIRAAWVQFWVEREAQSAEREPCGAEREGSNVPSSALSAQRSELWVEREALSAEREPCGAEREGSNVPSSALSAQRSALYETVVLSVDPAVSSKSTADRTALVTLGRTENNEIHCL